MPLSIFGKPKFVGVDIGNCTIAVATAEPSGRTYRIGQVAVCPTPKGSVADGVVTDAEAVGEAIRRSMREAHMSATDANLAVAGGSVVVRTVRMPRMPEAALRKSIKFEAGRYVPSSVDESYIEFEILGDTGEGQMEVLVAASPKDMVESKIAAAAEAGLDVEIVDVEAFALYRTLVEADDRNDAPNKTLALVDVGGENTHVSVVDHGSFALTRSIPIGGASITSALQNYFRLSPEEAEHGKQALDLGALISEEGPMENAPLRVIQPLADELVREIRRSLNYFQSQQTDRGQTNPVSELLLSGGGSLLKGLQEYLSHKLNLTVSAPSLFDNPRFMFSGSQPPADTRALAVAVGLAMRRPGKASIAA